MNAFYSIISKIGACEFIKKLIMLNIAYFFGKIRLCKVRAYLIWCKL